MPSLEMHICIVAYVTQGFSYNIDLCTCMPM